MTPSEMPELQREREGVIRCTVWLGVKARNQMKLDNLINKWTVLILGIWLLCAIAAAITRNGETMAYAFWVTVLIGIGYMLCYH